MTDEEKLEYAIEKEKIGKRIEFIEFVENIVSAVKEERPYFFNRMGDGTVWLLRKIVNPVGAFRYPDGNFCAKDSVEYLLQGTLEAIRNADMSGTFKNDINLYYYLNDNGCDIPKIRFHAFYNRSLQCYPAFVTEVFRKKKLLLIGSKALAYQKYLEAMIPEVRSIVYPGEALLETQKDCERILGFIERASFDVGIVSMGIWADIILHKIKKCGKIGIDYGNTMNLQLIGETYITLGNDVIGALPG